jgi:hypothetical protein
MCFARCTIAQQTLSAWSTIPSFRRYSDAISFKVCYHSAGLLYGCTSSAFKRAMRNLPLAEGAPFMAAMKTRMNNLKSDADLMFGEEWTKFSKRFVFA